MNEVTNGPAPERPVRRYEIDDDGNVHGVVFTVDEKDLLVFTDEAVTDPAELAKIAPRQDSAPGS